MSKFKSGMGFSIIELLVATAIFMVLAGAVFSVLFNSQVRYQSETGLTTAFQQANIVIDQIVRDIHSTGYPPTSLFASTTLQSHPEYAATAFPWSPNYPASPCAIGVCTTPTDDDLLLETGAGNGATVQPIQWIRYSLQGTTLMRGTMTKASGDPLSQSQPWSAQWTAYLEHVINETAPGSPAIFSYFDAAGKPTTQVKDIHEVKICLVVQSAQPDRQTGQYRVITVTGQGVAFNANQ